MRAEIDNGDPAVCRGRWAKAGNKPSTVFLSCRDCGAVGRLDATHAIQADGKVEPSVVCGCGWHKFVTLIGWNQ